MTPDQSPWNASQERMDRIARTLEERAPESVAALKRLDSYLDALRVVSPDGETFIPHPHRAYLRAWEGAMLIALQKDLKII